MNDSHERDFLLAEEGDHAAMQRLLAWLDDDLRTVGRGMARRTVIVPKTAYDEIRQEFVVAILEHKIHWIHD